MIKPIFEVNYTLPPALPYPWCSAYGEDRKGIWVEFSVRYGEEKKKKVKQRMRWINPGRFTMGSPEGEKERNDDEKQHEVTLTKGFWLANTACTQELWEAVMGHNPSKFKDPQRPVDGISWDDCQKFLTKIKNIPELTDVFLRLPTEAMWEYACRAETITPFSFGENVTPDQVNYDGTYPYSGGKIGKFKEATVDVKSFLPNGWGLYEMHGNVREWCSDWYGEYSLASVSNPIGPEMGSKRVLRGGSWNRCAGDCRSAFRYSNYSNDRRSRVGFRLSRCQ